MNNQEHTSNQNEESRGHVFSLFSVVYLDLERDHQYQTHLEHIQLPPFADAGRLTPSASSWQVCVASLPFRTC